MIHSKSRVSGLYLRNLPFSCFRLLHAVVIYLTIHFTAQAQLDSLIQEASQTHPDTITLALWNEIAFQYRSENADSTLYYAQQALELARKINDKKWVGRSYYSIGVGHHIKGNFDTAVDYYEQGIPLARASNDQKGLARLYNNLGLVDWTQGNLRTGLNYFLKSFKIDEALGDSSGMVTSINNIGLIHRSLNEHQEALNYFLQALDIMQEVGGDFRLSQLHNNLGMSYNVLEKYDTSLYHYQKSLKYADLANANCYKANPLVGIADLLQNNPDTDPDTLIYYGVQAVRVSEECGLPKIRSGAMILLGEAYNMNRDHKKAEESYLSGLQLATAAKIEQNMKDASERLYKLYKIQERWEEAFTMLEIFEATKSTLQSKEKIREVARLEAEFTADQEKQWLLAQQENERLNYEREKSQYMIFGLVSLFLVVLLAIIYRREKLNSNTLIKKNKVISELSSFKNELTQMIAHDIKNPLNSIIALSGQVEEKVGKDITKAGEAILRLITNMLDVEKFEDTTPELRLESVTLSDLFKEAKLAVELLLHDKSIRLQIDLDKEGKVTIDREMMVRVLINLLSNAIKYSPSNSVIQIESQVVTIDYQEYVRIGVIDQGTGIPEKDQPYLFQKFYQMEARKSGLTASTGLGLTFCKMAVNAHDGSISVESTVDEGTSFWITLKVEEVYGEAVHIEENTPELNISEREMEILKGYSNKLRTYKVYHVSSIMPILDEIDSLLLNTQWSAHVRSAVRYSNEKQFTELLDMI